MNNSNKSLAETFAENERKARNLTRWNMIIYIILIGFVVFFAFNWEKTEKKLKDTIQAKQSTNDSLDIANASLDSANIQLENFRISDSIYRKEIDSLRKDNPQLAKSLDSLSSQKGVTVYLQYIESYSGTADSVMFNLRSAKYRVPGKEKMKRANFNSYVKYFSKSDSAEARKIREIIKAKISRYAQEKLSVFQQKNISAPPGLIEVWLGKVIKSDEQQIKMNISNF
jgi:cell division protein FtsB